MKRYHSLLAILLFVLAQTIPLTKAQAADGWGYVGGGWINLPGPTPPVPGATIYSEMWSSSSSHLAVSNSLVKILSYFTGNEYVECSYWYAYSTPNGKESRAQGKAYYTIECREVKLFGIPSNLAMQVGEVQTIDWTYSPSDVTKPELTWNSSDYSVVEVNSNKITAKKSGSATITVKSNAGPTTYINVSVGGDPNIVYVNSITLNETSLTMNEGNTRLLEATVLPYNATDRSVSWSSNNSSIAQVNSSGLVTANATGLAIITCEANDGSGKSASCSVTVKSSIVEPISIVLPNYTEYIKVGESITLVPTIAPSNAVTTLTWTTSNSSVATVTQNGVVKGISAGEAKITVTTSNDKSAYCYVMVSEDVVYVSSISLNTTSVSLTEGDTEQLTATVLPSNATDKSVTWSSSNTSVATVSFSGLVTAKSVGSATITCKANDGSGKSATCSVTVNSSVVVPTSITVSPSSKTIMVGDTFYCFYTLSPSNASTTVTWSSDNSSIASVDSYGKVTGKSVGSTYINAKTSNGKTDWCKVTVESATLPKLTLSASPGGGQVTSGTIVTLTAKADGSTVSGCDIYYTLDGTTPKKSSMSYPSSGITISSSCTLKAIAYKDGYETSDVLTTSYSVADAIEPAEGAVAQVSAGGYHTMIVKTDGSLWACGDNYWGRLGDDTTTERHTPVKVMDGVAAVSAGGSHTMIIKTDGSLWACGDNDYGRLGDGTTTERHTPVKVMDGVAAVSAGGYHTMIVKTDGSLWACGYNNGGQLGDGTTTDRHTPVKVMDGVAAVSAGGSHTMIVKTDGSLWACGYNYYGQLGDGTTTDRHTPVNIIKGKAMVKLTVTASPGGGQVTSGTIVTLTAKADGSTVSGCDIYYTLNGTTPTKRSTKYTSSGITITSDCTLKAIAYNDGYETSDVLTETYTIKMDDIKVDIASSGYATFYSSESAYQLPNGLSASIVKSAGNGKLTYETIVIIEGNNMNIVPRGLPVMLQSSSKQAGTFTFTPVKSGYTYTGTNLLQGSDEATTTTGDGLHYKLSYGPSGTGWQDVFGWYWGAQNGAPFQIEGHKAWLVVPNAAKARTRGYSIDGDMLDVEEYDDGTVESVVYDLQGRKVSQPTKKGVYLRNGRKVVVK